MAEIKDARVDAQLAEITDGKVVSPVGSENDARVTGVVVCSGVSHDKQGFSGMPAWHGFTLNGLSGS